MPAPFAGMTFWRPIISHGIAIWISAATRITVSSHECAPNDEPPRAPYFADAEFQPIIDWISRGCPARHVSASPIGRGCLTSGIRAEEGLPARTANQRRGQIPLRWRTTSTPNLPRGRQSRKKPGCFSSVSARYLRAANAGLLGVRMESEMLEGVWPSSSSVSIFAPVFHQESKSQKTQHETSHGLNCNEPCSIKGFLIFWWSLS